MITETDYCPLAGDQPTRQLGMRVSLAGFLRNVAEELNRLAEEARFRASWTEDDDSQDDPCPNADWMVGQLREVSKHATETCKGKHSLQEFGEFYCLTGVAT